MIFNRTRLLAVSFGFVTLCSSVEIIIPIHSHWFSAQAASSSKLGNLSKFRSIAVDVESLVNKGDLSGAKSRIKDLEVIWDEAEGGIKSRSAADWHFIDKAIDRALSDLRASSPNSDSCKKSIADVLKYLDKVEEKK